MAVTQYQTYQAPAAAAEQSRPVGITINNDAGVTHRGTVRDGILVTEADGACRVNAAELNPHHGDGTVFASATSKSGSGVSEIKAETLLTYQGLQATASFWESQGLIHKTSEGTYQEGPGEALEAPQAAPEANPDALGMPDDVVAEVERALDGVADHHVAPLVASAIGVATGELDQATVIRQLVKFSGVSPEEAQARVSFVQQAYQAQADAALTGRCGVAEADRGDFYQWAKERQSGALRDAVQRQVQGSDLSGFRALAGMYLAQNPPTLEAVKAGGYETRKLGAKAEVLMDGRWMPIEVAARLGYL